MLCLFIFKLPLYIYLYEVFLLKVCCFAVAALLYSAFGVVIEKARGAEDDINTVAAGTLTGMLFKSGGSMLMFLIVFLFKLYLFVHRSFILIILKMLCFYSHPKQQ